MTATTERSFASEPPEPSAPRCRTARCSRRCPACCSAMFVAILSSHRRLDRAAADHRRPRRQPVGLHLGRHLDPAGADGHDADLGQALRPLRPQAAGPDGARALRGRLGARRPLAVHGLPDRLPRRAGDRRRRAHRARAGDPVRPRLPARARPLRGLSRRGVRRRHRRRPADRRRRHRRRSAGAGASTSACRSRVAAFIVLQRTLHLPRRRREAKIDYARRDADRGRRLDAADLGLARRPAVRLALLADRGARRRSASSLLRRRRAVDAARRASR